MIGILYFDETDVRNLSETIGNSEIICQVLLPIKNKVSVPNSSNRSIAGGCGHIMKNSAGHLSMRPK
ncbi:hypothetical protein [Peribacillus frigoritolerans]